MAPAQGRRRRPVAVARADVSLPAAGLVAIGVALLAGCAAALASSGPAVGGRVGGGFLGPRKQQQQQQQRYIGRTEDWDG